MYIVPNDARWNTLQALIAREIPDDRWTLRQLEEVASANAGKRFVQVVVAREGAIHAGEQVLGVGASEEAAVRDAIQTARRYPKPSA